MSDPAGARAVIDPASAIGEIDRRLFGSFVEHMGRAVYGGIFEPGHPAADTNGWRRDVLALVRELGVTVIRYPGGNFVSGYNWEDGVGSRAARAPRLDRAWRSIEPNLVGTDDFLDWTRLAGVEPLLAVNLGTGGAAEARNLVEYCNSAAGTKYADRRAANGRHEPHDVRLWCLGNEMDGSWQIGHKTATEYGRLAAEAGTAMRAVDPTIELVVCGSSGSKMPTFGTWEDTVLDLAWEVADHVSLHSYYDRAEYDGTDAYLACSRDLDRMIGTVAATADAVAARKGSRRQIGLSVDEWNVWHVSEHRAREDAAGGRRFRRAPAIAEDEQDLADALVVGCLLITLLRHADRVRIACLAQLVNVIAPIRTLDGGPAWRQTTYFPFAQVARFARGTVLRLDPDGPTYQVAGEGDVPAIEATAVHDAAAGRVTIFAVNRLDRPLSFDAKLRDLDVSVEEHIVLAGPSLSASNTAGRPDEVTPRGRTGGAVAGNRLSVELPARSWNVVRLGHGGQDGGP